MARGADRAAVRDLELELGRVGSGNDVVRVEPLGASATGAALTVTVEHRLPPRSATCVPAVLEVRVGCPAPPQRLARHAEGADPGVSDLAAAGTGGVLRPEADARRRRFPA